MNSIRIAIAAATFAIVSSAAIAGEANAAQTFGRDTVSAQGKSVATAQSKTRYANVVPGRQGGLSAEAKQALIGKARATADLVSRNGRA